MASLFRVCSHHDLVNVLLVFLGQRDPVSECVEYCDALGEVPETGVQHGSVGAQILHGRHFVLLKPRGDVLQEVPVVSDGGSQYGGGQEL